MTKITNFVWNPVDDCIISEVDETGAVQAVYTNEPQQYGGVISQRRGTTTSTYHADALGSTRFLTDSSGNVTDTYLNDAWGNRSRINRHDRQPVQMGRKVRLLHRRQHRTCLRQGKDVSASGGEVGQC